MSWLKVTIEGTLYLFIIVLCGRHLRQRQLRQNLPSPTPLPPAHPPLGYLLISLLPEIMRTALNPCRLGVLNFWMSNFCVWLFFDYPFSIVQDEEFKKFVNMLNPGYKLPTTKTLSQSLIPKMCTKQEEKVRHIIENANAACLTTDCWTSDNNQSCLAVTAHYIFSTLETTKLHSRTWMCGV